MLIFFLLGHKLTLIKLHQAHYIVVIGLFLGLHNIENDFHCNIHCYMKKTHRNFTRKLE